MLSVPLGPLALPVGPVIVLLSIWCATLASRLTAAPGHKAIAERIAWQAATLGLVAARITHLATHWQAYLDSPWSIIDLRDGGWSWPAGLAAAAAWSVFCALRQPVVKRAVLVGTAVGIGLWIAANIVLWWVDRQRNVPRIPDITVTSVKTGSVQPLAEVIGARPAIVNYWASWCGPCRTEMPAFAALQDQHPDLPIIFLNQAETPAQISEFLKRENLRLNEVWIDTASRFGAAVGSIGLPTTVFYDQSGRRINAHFGVISAAALRIEADKLLAAWPADSR